jgi:hypothetical protein
MPPLRARTGAWNGSISSVDLVSFVSDSFLQNDLLRILSYREQSSGTDFSGLAKKCFEYRHRVKGVRRSNMG